MNSLEYSLENNRERIISEENAFKTEESDRFLDLDLLINRSQIHTAIEEGLEMLADRFACEQLLKITFHSLQRAIQISRESSHIEGLRTIFLSWKLATSTSKSTNVLRNYSTKTFLRASFNVWVRKYNALLTLKSHLRVKDHLLLTKCFQAISLHHTTSQQKTVQQHRAYNQYSYTLLNTHLFSWISYTENIKLSENSRNFRYF